MNIGLIDVDSHNFPNLALMKISAFHKSHGDHVEWWWGFGDYDIVYMSKVFDDTYSKDVDEPLNARKIIKGGTGYYDGMGNRPGGRYNDGICTAGASIYSTRGIRVSKERLKNCPLHMIGRDNND